MVNANAPKVPTETVSLVVNKVFGPKVRAYLYISAFLAGIVLAVLGKVSSGQLSDWLLFAGTILGVGSTGLATANKPQKIQSRPDIVHPDALEEGV